MIYAELLSNIRQISVIAALGTPCDASTNVVLSPNGREVILHHHGSTNSLNLPGQVASNSRLQKPALGSEELSWRLPLSGPTSRPNAESDVSNDAPWPATDLKDDTEFSCRSCGAIILKKGIIKSWRDLPSENWAEMMDFWHCHKPDVPELNGNGHSGHSHGDPNASRGYGANIKFTAQSGIGFVDLTTFLVSKSDCSGAEVSCLSYFVSVFCALKFALRWVSRRRSGRALAPRWSGHRYKYPISTPSIPLSDWSCLPSSSDYGFDDQFEDKNLGFSRIILKILEAHGVTTRDICRLCSNATISPSPSHMRAY